MIFIFTIQKWLYICDQITTIKNNIMKTSMQNSGARLVKEMINNKESLKSIIAFSIGYGFDIDSYKSHVHILDNKVSLIIARDRTYYYL